MPFLDYPYVAMSIANVTANSTTISMASTSVYDLLKRGGIRKIQLEEVEKLFTTSTRTI